MRKVLLFLFLLSFNGVIYSQWTYDSDFPTSDSFLGTSGCHGLVIDNLGRIWIQIFSNPHAIYCYNPDGTEASFSPITSITVNGVTTFFDTTDARGLSTNHQGNILVSTKRDLFLVDYLTGSGIEIVSPYNHLGALTAPSADEEGNVYMANVLGGFPTKEFDSNLNFISDITDSIRNIGRTISVTKDGLSIWIPRFQWSDFEYNGGSIYRYYRTSKSSDFNFIDSIFVGLVIESMAWQPVTNYLWVSSGSYYNLPDTILYTPNVWYAIDINTNTIVDSIKWKFNYPFNAYERPRAIAFSPDGNTAYVACIGATWYNSPSYPPVQKFIRNTSHLLDFSPDMKSDFILFQNYPNPFNPTTTIKYTLSKQNKVVLKIYNSLGQEVKTLFNDIQSTGQKSIVWDGKDNLGNVVGSGVYIYQLNAGNKNKSKKMLFFK